MLKSYGVGWAAHVILVSALGPNPSFFLFWGLLFNLGICWDRGLDSDLDQGLTIVSMNKFFWVTLIIWSLAAVRNQIKAKVSLKNTSFDAGSV